MHALSLPVTSLCCNLCSVWKTDPYGLRDMWLGFDSMIIFFVTVNQSVDMRRTWRGREEDMRRACVGLEDPHLFIFLRTGHHWWDSHFQPQNIHSSLVTYLWNLEDWYVISLLMTLDIVYVHLLHVISQESTVAVWSCIPEILIHQQKILPLSLSEVHVHVAVIYISQICYDCKNLKKAEIWVSLSYTGYWPRQTSAFDRLRFTRPWHY